MAYSIVRKLPGYQPVFVSDQGVVLFRRDRIYLASHDLDDLRLICALPPRLPLVARFGPRILQRILRTGIISAAMPDPDTLYVVRRDQIFRINLSTGACHLDFVVPGGRRLLELAMLRDEEGRAFLAFGEYFNNPEKLPVSIWRRDMTQHGTWAVAASFPPGEINHVHALCQTAADGTTRILTGDFGDASAIWASSSNFGDIKPVHRGSQAIRACWLRELTPGEFYFATDSQFEENRLRRFYCDRDPVDIAVIEGSSIYSSQNRQGIFFSTTVEPGHGSGSFWRDMIERKPGPGIRSTNAVIYAFTPQGIEEVVRAPKDVWPMRLAQFGTFMFPQGTMPDNRFYAYGNAVRGYENTALCFERQS